MLNTEKVYCSSNSNETLPTGVHILGDFFEIDSDIPQMIDSELLKELCLESVIESGLTIVNSQFHKFDEGGITGIVLLAESHVAIHTWPEKNYLSLDVFVCNLCEDNTEKARNLFSLIEKAFHPGRIKKQEVLR